MYDIFEALCKKYGITAYKFCKDTGIRSSTISTWKKNNSLAGPKLSNAICSYFGISHDYLMTGKEENDKKELDLVPVADRDISSKLDDLSRMLESQSDPIYYKGNKIELSEQNLRNLQYALGIFKNTLDENSK